VRLLVYIENVFTNINLIVNQNVTKREVTKEAPEPLLGLS
jgi:hypothetical protein